MGLILFILLLALLFGGFGFAIHWLWIIALVLFVVFLWQLVTGRRGG